VGRSQAALANLRVTRRWHSSNVFRIAIIVALTAPLLVLPGGASSQTAATGCPADGCTVTVRAFDPANPNANPGIGAGLGQGAALPTFNFLINLDNTRLPLGAIQPDGSATAVQEANGYAATESNSPIFAEGGCSNLACDGVRDRNVVKLPTGRYLISMRAPDHKLWGRIITLPADAGGDGSMNADIVLTEASEAKPLPLGSNKVLVFNDNGWTNGEPDTDEPGLEGFKIEMYEQTFSAVTADYHNKPLCADPLPTAPAPGSWPNCETDSDGFVEVDNLSPATYFTEVVPPEGPCNSNPDSLWYQTTTIDGGLELQTPVWEGADGSGPPTALAADLAGVGAKRTVSWFGFVCAPVDIADPGTGRITGTARNIQPWTSAFDTTFGEVVQDPFVALSDIVTNETIYVGQGDDLGNFDIQGIPAGTYHLAIWDEQLNYIISFNTVTVGNGQEIDLNTTDSRGESGVGIPRWFGWLDGTVYKDQNGNGMMDDGEPPVANTDVDQRWRDGSIKEATFTDAEGHYEYPTAEGGTLNHWIINEQGFARFSAYPGPSLHDEQNPSIVYPSCAVEPPLTPAPNCLPVDQGGALLSNQLNQPDHRTTVDWGKRDYPAGVPGQIVGVTYYATTRNEFHANLQAHEDYEPAVPDVNVYLEGLGPDGQPNTADDVLFNKYVTDHWQHPTASQDPPQTCKLIDSTGADVTGDFNPLISSLCIEEPITGAQTKDGAFDGGYAFTDYCPNGYDEAAPDPDSAPCWNAARDDHVPTEPLVAGTYITHFTPPTDPAGGDTRPCNTDAANPNVSTAKGEIPGGGDGCLYRPVKEEDVNVDLGAQFTPAIPPPDCVGDDHVIDQTTLVTRSPFFGKPGSHAPLCDKRLVVLRNQQNANADFNLMTNFPTDPNGADDTDTRIGDIQEPGRIAGIALNDLMFETDPNSVLFGDNAGSPGLSVGIYARYDDNPDNWRLFTTVTTSDIGTYEALLPSLETLNCPIPQGPCPGMYRFLVNDPGTPNHPNAGYDPGFVRGTDYIFDVWPGQTDDSLDTPMIPNAAGADCLTPSGNPELLEVSKAVVSSTNATAASRRITIKGVGFGTTPGTVRLADPRSAQSRTLGPSVNPSPSLAAGGVVSWTDRQIVIQVPAASSSFQAGQKQLSITENGRTTENGITIHVRGTGYNPTIVNVPAWNSTTNRHAIQNALDSAASGSLLLLAPGTYYESVVMWKPVKIQGRGVGGMLGAENLFATNPGDPRFAIQGSTIDGRFFPTYAADWNATVAAHANSGTPKYQGANALADVMAGADVLVLAKTTTAYTIPTGTTGVFSAARIDGVGMTNGGGDPGAGGVQLQARADNTQITNNVLEGNSGGYAGGIGIGRPDANSHNFNVRMAFDRLLGNGSGGTLPAVHEGGGIGIFGGSNTYDIANSLLCSNHTGEPDSQGFGGGLLHYGRSLNGNIHENRIVFNSSIESGGGIAIQQEVGATVGSGPVNIDRNLIQTNQSGNKGGGILIEGARTDLVNIRNNMINDNLASDRGAIMLHDSTTVQIMNNTVANNASAASPVIGSADTAGHSAGLAVSGNSAAFQATLPAGSPQISRPSVLRNNIFWQNEAFVVNVKAPRATLLSQGYLDFEVFGAAATATLTPSYSDLTNGKIRRSDGTIVDVASGQHNTMGDPKFVQPFKLVLSVDASSADPTLALVTIVGLDPPDEDIFGDYHIRLFGTTAQRTAQATASPVIDRGVSFTGVPTVDFDGQTRPILDVSGRSSTRWDFGADERGLTP
jgi:SdrD B-like protein